MGDEATVTLEFLEEDGYTVITSTIDIDSTEARDAATSTGMTDYVVKQVCGLTSRPRDLNVGGKL